MSRFTNKVIIITGAASGLGKATATTLAAEGAKLVLVDLNEAALNATQTELTSANAGAEILTVTANVADEAQVQNYVDQTVEKFGRIDGFFNNAGIEGKQNLTEDFGADEFEKVVSINLKGVFYGQAAVLKVMRQQGSGAIVNTASVGGITGVGNQSGYAASKHGVVGLTRNSAREYGQFGISINAIAPGAIMTDMVRKSLLQLDPENPDEAGKQFVSVNPMKRFGQPEEVAELVAFLLSQSAPFINAAVIPIDGGQSAMY